MTRFSGVVGYGESQESPPGSGDYKKVITERQYSGRVVRNSRRLRDQGQVNPDLTLDNSIEIVADPYARDNMDKLLYVVWRGRPWKVDLITDLTPNPRLLLKVGELYTGPRPAEVTP
jgi:hypothetical protein